MRLFIFLLLSIGPTFAVQAADETKSAEKSIFLRTHDVRPCDYWTRDPDTMGYVCNFYPSRINVADGYDTEREINSLVEAVRGLTARVEALEQQLCQ